MRTAVAMNVLRILVALSAVALAAGAYGAPVVKYRMPDGRIVYSDEVPPTGKPLGVMPEPPPRQAIEPDRVARMKREREATDKAVARRLTVHRSPSGSGARSPALRTITISPRRCKRLRTTPPRSGPYRSEGSVCRSLSGRQFMF